MVEFRRDFNDGQFKLMEINPKFWGSLDLAIAAGVDFPYHLYKMVIEGDINPIFNYKVGLRFMWPLPDDLLRTLNKLTSVKSFLSDLFNPYVKKNIVLTDLKPTLSLIWNGISLIMSKKVPRLVFPRSARTF
jgi:predicted ATP-grasp superfamily ATP-dependent carboligase